MATRRCRPDGRRGRYGYCIIRFGQNVQTAPTADINYLKTIQENSMRARRGGGIEGLKKGECGEYIQTAFFCQAYI